MASILSRKKSYKSVVSISLLLSKKRSHQTGDLYLPNLSFFSNVNMMLEITKIEIYFSP
jgi:hypothetical protein